MCVIKSQSGEEDEGNKREKEDLIGLLRKKAGNKGKLGGYFL